MRQHQAPRVRTAGSAVARGAALDRRPARKQIGTGAVSGRVLTAVRLPEAERLAREGLAQTRLAEAARLVEQAQHILDRAARNLCPIIGAASLHSEAGRISQACYRLWDRIESFEMNPNRAIDGEVAGRAEVEP